MLRFSRLSLLIALATASLPAAWAQSDYGSVYSRFALGQRHDVSSSQADAMGVSGVALRSGLYNGLANPAHAADQSLATFSASGLVRGVRATDQTDASSDATAGGLGFVQLGLPLYSNKLGLTVSYQPYTRVDYRAAEEGMVDVDGGEPTPFRANLEGAGGLQRLSLGLGGRLSNAFRVGVSGEALIGSVESLQRTEFLEASSAFFETREATATRLYGFTGTVGAAATIRQLADETDALTFAGSFTLPTTLRGSRAVTLGTSLNRDTLATQDAGDVRIPLTARAGVAYQRGASLVVAADAVYEPWSQFESDFAFAGMGARPNAPVMADRVRVGGGLEFTPGGARRGATYFQRVHYRLGAYAESGFVQADGQNLLTRAITGGLSLPTRLGGTRIDIGGEIGTRGEASGVLVRDLFWRGTLTLNFGERWFLRRRLG